MSKTKTTTRPKPKTIHDCIENLIYDSVPVLSIVNPPRRVTLEQGPCIYFEVRQANLLPSIMSIYRNLNKENNGYSHGNDHMTYNCVFVSVEPEEVADEGEMTNGVWRIYIIYTGKGEE